MTDTFTPEETMTFPELAPGRKDDASKTLAGLLKDFAPALLDVAEVGTFGDTRSSLCAVQRDGGSFRLEKAATTVSYGAHADALLMLKL